jgi:pimeloyl-ACP methyl ester carboxylesterase
MGASTSGLRASDGTNIVYVDEGSGPTIIVLHGGLSDESAWALVAAELSASFRVIRIRRRLYRLDLTPDPATDFEREVDDVLELAESLGGSCVLVGHSSGAVVALETLARDASPFVGAALYEPPLALDGPLGGPAALPQARSAMAAGRPGKALQIFIRRMVRMPVPAGVVMRVAVRFDQTLRAFVPRQLDDTEAIDRLGNRLDVYGKIPVSLLLITGSRSPAHLLDRSARLADRLPGLATVAVLDKQGHGANRDAPEELAARIAMFASPLLVPGTAAG